MEDDEIIKGLAEKTIKFRDVENLVDGDVRKATELRARAVERIRGFPLKHITHYSIDPAEASQKNIENMIGVVQIPMGLAGPLQVNGEYARGEYYVPLTTTEGALIASVNRGTSVITNSGGSTTTIMRNGITRAPVMKVPSARHAKMVTNWIRDNFEKVKMVAEHEEPYLKLLNVVPYVVGRNLYLRFIYDTYDAMGMNMVTFGTDQALELIEKEFSFVQHVALSGNMCIDKKPSALDFIAGRGKSVVAEVTIPKDVVRDKLKTTPEAIIEVNYRKNLLGSAQAGSYGFNAQFANMVAALYLATGQDEAHVVEGSLGITTAEMIDTEDGEKLHMAVTMPCVQVGTVGGGTRVETQREALMILGLYGGGNNNSLAFSEIVASVVLAGEISLIGALAARHLSKAHKELGR